MGRFVSGFILPLLLLAAASLNWSLISLGDLLASLLLQLMPPTTGLNCRKRSSLLWCMFLFATLATLSNVTFQIILAIEGNQWSMIDTRWENLIGLTRDLQLCSPSMMYVLVVQPLIALVALSELYASRNRSSRYRHFCLECFTSSFDHTDLNLKGPFFFLLPIVQLIVGVSHPSWVSLPFFICSCIGLVNWSLTSNILGFFRAWKYILLYAGFNIILLYVYQLPLEFSSMFQWLADFIGLFKISMKSTLSETCFGVSLLIFHFMLSSIRSYLLEKELISATENSLTEQLLPSNHRSGVSHFIVSRNGAFSWTFSVNFFTFGLPISLLVVSFWTFHFASICTLGLVVYAGYILHTFPSLFRLHQLNCVLLGFILLWAACTYVFNVAFTLLDDELQKDMDLWESIGLWHYPIPGVYILEQFCLGTFVAMGNQANRSILQYLSGEDVRLADDHDYVEENVEPEALIIATFAWGLRKVSRVVLLSLMFSIALTPGYIPSVYMIFFVTYLLKHTISRRMNKSLILLCEIHFMLKYALQLNLLYKALEHEGSFPLKLLSDFGLLDHSNFVDFVKIGGLACLCAAYRNGPDMLLTFSTILQQIPFSPFCWGILRACLNKSVLLSVYKASSSDSQFTNSSQARSIASYLSTIDQRLLSTYRSCGTYTVSATILVMVYLMTPNYASFGYLFFLLQWMTGRQLLEKTRRKLWFPLKVYAVFMFLILYGLSTFISFRVWLSRKVDLFLAFGYDPKAPTFNNIWKSLVILVVMQFYSYERSENKIIILEDSPVPELRTLPFYRRFLMWHSEKILFIALLYASLSPISASGFLYLLGLVISSTLPKSSRLPSKLFIAYTAILLMADYLFQIWGGHAEMFPGQKQFSISRFIGLTLFTPGFVGIESGLRGKVLVIVACLLQYNVFCWLDKTHNYKNRGKWEEPCALFGPEIEGPDGFFVTTEISSPWDKHAENFTWSKKLHHVWRKERLEMQKATLKAYIKYWMDNIFNVSGLEISMITLLLASFAVLNAISLLYVSVLAVCVLLPRHMLKKLWPIFILLFASVVIVEYMAIWLTLTSWKEEATITCRDCWRSSQSFPVHCKKCWLGIIVDDPRMLISYYVVLMVACFKLRADHLASLSEAHNYRKMRYQYKKASLLGDLSFETKNMWTVLDYVRHYSYCHLLNLVLALILITGTLEYDILHLGYLGFAMVFLRIRLEILKKKNAIFKYLQMYNFGLIVLSLAYQSPYVGNVNKGKCGTIDYIYEVIGFRKYDYGFQITSRSALVEIVIFALVSLQAYMFSSAEFGYVSRYLEAEHIDALVREKEKRAAWKTEQLQHIRKSEEQKRLQNLQVENMKSEVLSLQIHLHSMTNKAMFGNFLSEDEGCTRRKSCSLSSVMGSSISDKEKNDSIKHSQKTDHETLFPFMTEFPSRSGSPVAANSAINSMDSLFGISDFDMELSAEDLPAPHIRGDANHGSKRKTLVSAVRFLGDGVSQVRSLGRFAVTNLAKILDIKKEEVDSDDGSSDDGVYYEVEDQNIASEPLGQTSSMQSGFERAMSEAPGPKLGTIFRYLWAKMRANNEIVCYCCFILIFLWNFSLLSMVYLAALFLYALCVNSGPSTMFWVIMLMYTEFCILIQYLYQIVTQHCGVKIELWCLEELGFPVNKIVSSFVASNFPLFLVYLFVLLQSSIAVRFGEWVSATDFSSLRRRNVNEEEHVQVLTYGERIGKILSQAREVMIRKFRSLSRYWQSVTEGAETPPFFVQLSMEVNLQPDEGIQPERIESGINKLLKVVHNMRCNENTEYLVHSANRVLVQSIERSSENSSVALVVLEVVHENPVAELILLNSSLTPAADVADEIQTAQQLGVLKEIGFPYPIVTVIGGGKRGIDLYAYVFCADLVVFALVSMFYHSIIKNNSKFLEVYQLEDQFPIEFVFLLMILFFLIVLDRVIYLFSSTTGKVIFYLFTLVLFTYSATQYAWHMGPLHNHDGKLALRAIFLTKAISLALQATQIRYGIPDKSSLYRKFLTESVSQFNFMCFRLYRALPFLYELRCILDWSCTATALTMYDWLKLEDIYASLFLVKCDVDLNRAKHQQGQRQSKMTKFCSGICLFFVLLCVIWAPMLMYSSGNPTNIANPIKDASVRIDLKTNDGRLMLFETTICEKFIWDKLDKSIDLDPQGYLTEYNKKDVQLICCQADASTLWLVPPVVQARFVQSLNWSMEIVFYWQFIRDRPKNKELVKYELVVPDENLPSVNDVMKVLNGTSERFSIYNVYPRYFRVTGSGDVRFLEKAVHMVSGNIVLNQGIPQWWSFRDMNASDVRGCGQLAGPMAIIVSEETPQGILGETLSKFSIWGLYITFVLAVGRFIRLQCSDLRMRIPFENLPSCDRLLAICENIYVARAEGELEVEEVLYWILVKIYRSPHILLEYTKVE